MVLTAGRRGLVPGGACLPDARELRSLVARLGDAGRAGWGAAATATGWGAATTTVDLTSWETAAQIERVDLRSRPVVPDPRSVAALVAHANAEQRETGAGVMDPRPLRSLATPLVRAALDGDGPQVAWLLARLVGAGPGATPAGDDVVVGALAALDAVAGSMPAPQEPRAARDLIARHLTGMLDRTTAVSRHDLAAAVAGRFAEHVHDVIAALGDPAAVPGVLSAARTWGATSGTDLTCGVAFSLAALIPDQAGHRDLAATRRRSA